MTTESDGDVDGGSGYGAEHFTPEDVNSAAFVTARLRLTETRGISPARATEVLLTNECWECPCTINEPQGPTCPGCACHCECCCPPLYSCIDGCKCQCQCHFTEGKPDEIVAETSQSGAESAAESADVAAQAPAQSQTHPISVGSATADGKQEGPAQRPAAPTAAKAKSGSEAETREDGVDNELGNGESDGGDTSNADPDNAEMSDGRAEADDMSDETSSSDGEDIVMTQVQLPDTATPAQLYAAIVNERDVNPTADNPRYDRIVRMLFKRAYDEAVPSTLSKTKEDQLPSLEATEVDELKDLLTVLLEVRKLSLPRLMGVLKEVSKASARSSWNLSKILRNRTASAKIPDSTPANVWTGQPRSQPEIRTDTATQYMFDPATYSLEECVELKALCEQPHVFAETTRPPSPEEWKVIMGMITGTILATALPQFLKRCATMRQIAWIHTEMMARAEGELWTKLPTLSKMYNYNQSSKRLITELRTSAAQYGYKDPRFDAMLKAVKVATYNHEMHSLHFHFFTKAAAAQWTGLVIPFRKSKLALRNPDSEIMAATHVPGAVQLPGDKLVNDRYQANYKLRLTNITHMLDVDGLTKYLEVLTDNGVKTGAPLDSYGPNSEWSLTWDVYAKRPACPPQLLNINRIMWGSHTIMIQHNPGQGRAPCLLCAQTGHQVATCTVAEEDRYKTNTLIVTNAEIEKLHTPQQQWTTAEDALAVFTHMGAAHATVDETTTPPTIGVAADQKRDEPKDQESGGTSRTPGKVQEGDHGGESGTASASNDTKAADKEGSSPPAATQTGKVGSSNATTKGKKNGKANDKGKPRVDDWSTKSSRRNSGQAGSAHGTQDRPKGEGRTEPQGSTVAAGPAPEPTHPTPAGASPNTANKFIDLASDDEESDDERDDGSEEEKAGEVSANHASSSSRVRRSGRAGSHGKPTAATEEEALERAVAWARIEKLREAVHEHLGLHRRQFDATEPLAALARALPNVAPKSSRGWILESVGGRLASTPMTGNCQPLAMTEALYQEEIRGSPNRTAMVETTMMGKLGMLYAAEHEVLDSTLLTNVASILDNPAGTRSDESPAEQRERARTFYKDLALTGSDVTDPLPRGLWGGYDSIRMMAKLLNRRIYLISQFADKTNVHLNLMEPQLSKQGHPTCMMYQPGTKVWLESIAADLTNGAEAPIILSYEGEHYNAVLLDRHVTPADRSAATKMRSTSIPELWTQVTTSLDVIIDTAAKKARTTQAIGPTHAEVIRADARVTEEDLYAFLVQDNWSIAEKKEIIAILVAGKLNYKELLTAVVTPGGTDSQASSGVAMSTESGGSEDSEWSADDGSGTDSGVSSQAYSLSQPMDGEYREWADAMWESVTAVWEEQHNQPIPALTEGPALEKLARNDPPLVCELGRWCDNPFVLLDHFSQTGIRDWMESKRQEYIIRELTTVASHVVDSQVKTVLLEWLAATTALEPKLARVRLREQGMWELLKQAAPQTFNKTTAPFLTRDYSTTCAYVLVLDELYPDLAGHALRNSGYMDTEGSTLIDAYCRVPELRQVLKLAQGPADKGGKSWEPIEKYLNSLRQLHPAAAGAQY